MRKQVKEKPTFKVYIISPLNAPTQEGIEYNMKRANHWKHYFSGLCRLNNSNVYFRCYAPHSYLPKELDDNDPMEREIAINFGLQILEMCDAVTVFAEEGRLSGGMTDEIVRAIKTDKIIFADSLETARSVYDLAEKLHYSIDVKLVYDKEYIRSINK